MGVNPILPLEHLVLLAIAAMAATGFFAWRSSSKSGWRRRAVSVLLRVLAVGGLALIALNPGRWQENKEDQRSQWAVLVDRSLSMSTADADGHTRWEAACRLARKAHALSTSPHDVQVIPFADHLEDAVGEKLDELKPDGENTDVVEAGKSLLNRFRTAGRPLTGVLLISDGRQVEPSTHEELGLRARSRQTPIYTLALGAEVADRDLRVTARRRQVVAFEGQRARIAAVVENRGFGNISPVLELVNAAGETAAEQRIDIAAGASTTVQFDITAGESGYRQYTVRTPRWEDESSTDNNAASVGVVTLGTRIKIFLVEGTPYWDSKFLVQLLRKQPNMEVTSVYRLSSDRFFKVETDVSRVAEASTAIFPESAEELAAYDLVVFGKGMEYFLTPDRIHMLQDFVRNQGGGIVFSRGKPYKGTLPELAPLEPVVWGEPRGEPFLFRPVRAGEDAGLFGGLLPGWEDPVWQSLPLLKAAHRCERLKAFATVLVQGVSETGDRNRATPVVISRRYGKGMVLTVNAEGLWQWDFFPSVKEAGNMYQEIWTQLLQWAVTYSEFLPGQTFALQLSQAIVLPDVPVHGRIHRRHGADPIAPPAIRVLRGATVTQELSAADIEGTGQQWEFAFSLPAAGTYCVELADPTNGASLGPRSTLTVRPVPAERDNLSADPEFLSNLALPSGGRKITEDELDDIVRSLEPEARPLDINKAVWQPLWDRGWLLAVLLALLGTECFIRRRNGLI